MRESERKKRVRGEKKTREALISGYFVGEMSKKKRRKRQESCKNTSRGCKH